MKKTDFGIKAILSGGLSLTISTLIVKILGLVYKIPLANILHDEGMGYFNSAYTVYSFFYLLCTAGVPKAIMILVSESTARGDEDKARKIVSVGIKAFCFIGIIMFMIITVFAIPLAKLIGNNKAAVTIIFVAPSIIFISVSGVIRGYLNAKLKLLDIAVSQVIEGLIKLVSGLSFAKLALHLNMSVEMISAMTILGVSLGSLAGLAHLWIVSKVEIRKEKAGQSSILRNIFKISAPITLSAAIMSLTNIIDLGLIMNSLEKIGYTELEAGALYGNYTTLAVPMLNLAMAIITPISVSFIPAITTAIAKNDLDGFSEAESTEIRLCSFVVSPMIVGLMTYSSEILSILFPASDIDVGAALLCLLCPSILFSSLLIIVNNSLEAGGRFKAPLISMSVGCIVKILVSYLLIKNPSFGISGAPIGTVLCYGSALMVSVIIYKLEYGKTVDVFSGFSTSILFALASVLMSKNLYKLLLDRIGNILSISIIIVFCAVVYFVFSLLMELIKGRGKIKIAKYTKTKAGNCKINT